MWPMVGRETCDATQKTLWVKNVSVTYPPNVKGLNYGDNQNLVGKKRLPLVPFTTKPSGEKTLNSLKNPTR
jgi:hypothetical protein